MVKKTDVKAVAIVIAGVIAAGLIMRALADVEFIDSASKGYGG